MSRHLGESRIREFVQQLKQADEQSTPDFTDVFERTPRPACRRPAHRVQLALLGCTLVVSLLLIRSQLGGPANDGTTDLPENRQLGSSSGVSEMSVDSSEWHQAVEEYFRNASLESSLVPGWSSTDSLLAVNLNVPLTRE